MRFFGAPSGLSTAASAVRPGEVKRALPTLQARNRVLDGVRLEVLGLSVGQVPGLVDVLLVEEEDPRIGGVAVGQVHEVAGFAPRRFDQLLDSCRHRVFLAGLRRPLCRYHVRHTPRLPRGMDRERAAAVEPDRLGDRLVAPVLEDLERGGVTGV